MPSFIKSPALIVSLGAAIVFSLCSPVFSPDVLSDATATVMMVAFAIGLWRWGPTGWRVFWKGAKRAEDWGILAALHPVCRDHRRAAIWHRLKAA